MLKKIPLDKINFTKNALFSFASSNSSEFTFNSRFLHELKHNMRLSIALRNGKMKIRTVLLIFSLELERFALVVQGIYQNSRKWLLAVRIFLVEMTLRFF